MSSEEVKGVTSSTETKRGRRRKDCCAMMSAEMAREHMQDVDDLKQRLNLAVAKYWTAPLATTAQSRKTDNDQNNAFFIMVCVGHICTVIQLCARSIIDAETKTRSAGV